MEALGGEETWFNLLTSWHDPIHRCLLETVVDIFKVLDIPVGKHWNFELLSGNINKTSALKNDNKYWTHIPHVHKRKTKFWACRGSVQSGECECMCAHLWEKRGGETEGGKEREAETYFTALMCSQLASPMFVPFCSLVRPWTVNNYSIHVRYYTINKCTIKTKHTLIYMCSNNPYTNIPGVPYKALHYMYIHNSNY